MLRAKVRGDAPPESFDVWWRADDKRYANYDPWAEFEQMSGSHLSIELTPYIVVKYTPKGVRLQDFMGGQYLVLGKSIRQQAVPTKELALRDLVFRKEKHVRMSELRAEEARQHLKAAERCLKTERAC